MSSVVISPGASAGSPGSPSVDELLQLADARSRPTAPARRASRASRPCTPSGCARPCTSARRRARASRPSSRASPCRPSRRRARRRPRRRCRARTARPSPAPRAACRARPRSAARPTGVPSSSASTARKRPPDPVGELLVHLLAVLPADVVGLEDRRIHPGCTLTVQPGWDELTGRVRRRHPGGHVDGVAVRVRGDANQPVGGSPSIASGLLSVRKPSTSGPPPPSATSPGSQSTVVQPVS